MLVHIDVGTDTELDILCDTRLTLEDEVAEYYGDDLFEPPINCPTCLLLSLTVDKEIFY